MASQSKFIGNFKLWAFVIPLVMIFFVPFFSAPWIYSLHKSEVAENVRIFGVERHKEIEKAVDERFANWFIRSGIYHASTDGTADKSSIGFGKLHSEFAQSYLRNFWKVVYRALYRFEITKHWFIGAFIIIFAAMYDGLQQRRIKASEAGYSNPMIFHFAGHGLVMVIGMLIAVPFLPMTFSSLIWFAIIVSLALLGWKTMESFQTGAN
jgi:hypothetical protein